MFSVKVPATITELEVAFRNDVYRIVINRSSLFNRVLFTVDSDTGSITRGLDLEDVDIYEMDFDLTKTLITITVSEESIVVCMS